MLGRIEEILDNTVIVQLDIDIFAQPNLVGLHIILEDENKKIVAEIENIDPEKLKANIIGELIGQNFIPGSAKKPSFKSNVRIINLDELESLLGPQETTKDEVYLGISNVYDNYKINVNLNDFFSNHFSILGNSGSGKSFTVSGFLQRLFTKTPEPPLGANLFLFDAYGEYTNAFEGLREVNSNLNYKTYTTNTKNPETDILRIPLWLLDVDDIALLLDVTTPNQLPIIEKSLKLVPILAGDSPDVIRHKNDIIARALQDILLSGNESTKIRDQIIAILTKFNTEQLNLESKISQPGYIRTLKQCLYIDKTGKMQEMEIVVDFINGFIEENLNLDTPERSPYYTLIDLEYAMEFALISEGVLKSDKVYDMANVLLVRLHTITSSEQSMYFEYPEYVDRTRYINDLLTGKNGVKCQIVNFNINYVDDRLAKVITKIISRLLFKEAVNNPDRGSIPYHIIIEEAHRYVQKDTDLEVLGYNIFDRITKEGRKYGVILGLITQRPSELSDTAISQCSNFIILKMSHPLDLEYIRTMVPNVSSEIVNKLKSLKPGNCVAFGSAFKAPVYLYVERPNPTPLSNNVDISRVWRTTQTNNLQMPISSNITDISNVSFPSNEQAQTSFVTSSIPDETEFSTSPIPDAPINQDIDVNSPPVNNANLQPQNPEFQLEVTTPQEKKSKNKFINV